MYKLENNPLVTLHPNKEILRYNEPHDSPPEEVEPPSSREDTLADPNCPSQEDQTPLVPTQTSCLDGKYVYLHIYKYRYMGIYNKDFTTHTRFILVTYPR